MATSTRMISLDWYVFRWIIGELKDASPDKIVSFYVDKFIFKNGDYLKYLIKKYRLPNDILKLHARILKLGGQNDDEKAMD